jgi:deoxycytidylate deaminase
MMPRPEIVIGIVAAVGTDTAKVSKLIVKSLKDVGYVGREVCVSQLPRFLPNQDFMANVELKTTPYDEYVNSHMDMGNALRFHYDRGDAMAVLSIIEIREQRIIANTPHGTDPNELNKKDEQAYAKKPLANTAFIIRQLKHDKEVELLRKVYGDSFLLISAYSPRDIRKQVLASKIATSRHKQAGLKFEREALQLIERDEEETTDTTKFPGADRAELLKRRKLGQQVRETFWRGDAYIDAQSELTIERDLVRIIQIWFSHPFKTPTRDEFLMFLARAAAYRSSSMGRQVGASIGTSDGSVIATGTNEVPKANGGQYWEGDDNDGRDHIRGADSAETMKLDLLNDLVGRLEAEGWTPPQGEEDFEKRVERLLYGESPPLKGSHLDALIEYQRPVHAEMSAITDAARRGVPVQGATLYTTTFPCHGCARHAVAAGISRVVFIEPYAKSLATVLHADSIALDFNSTDKNKVHFEPFVGVAPRRYLSMFQMGETTEYGKRKDSRGNKLDWNPTEAQPRIGTWLNSQSVEIEEQVLNEWNAISSTSGNPPK